MTPVVEGPLAGIRVLDLGTMIAGPAAASLLADQGAEVIKIESPGIGDVMRYLGASRGGVSSLFHASNRGKRSLSLNLKSAEGVALLRELVATSDVVMHNLRHGVTERLGIDYASLAPSYPELIYLSVTGFGSRGPMAGFAAYDNVVQAFSGVAASQAKADTGEPVYYYQLFCDKVTALTGAQAVTAALLARERGRGGQHIELSMVDSVCSFLWHDLAAEGAFIGEGASRGMNFSRAELTRFADGWGAVAPVTDAQFHGCCRAFGVDSSAPELATVAQRNANRAAFAETLGAVKKAAEGLSVEEALQRLVEQDVPCARAMRLAELPDHPQLQANESFVQTHHPAAGEMLEPRNPPRFSSTPSGVGGPSPLLGEQTDEILGELGYDGTRIAGLRESGIVS